MRRSLAWVAGAIGAAALARLLRRRETAAPPVEDPAAELRRRLAEARSAEGEREEFEAGETPVDAAEAPRSIAERRQAVHEQAQQALDEMRSLTGDEPK